MLNLVNQLFPNGNASNAFQGIYQEILRSAQYHRRAQAYSQGKAEAYGKPGTYKLSPMIPPAQTAFRVNFKPPFYQELYVINHWSGLHVGDLGISLGWGHFGYESATLTITGCPGHLKWRVSAEMMERNRYHFHFNPDAKKYELVDPVYEAGYELQHHFGFKPFDQQSTWH